MVARVRTKSKERSEIAGSTRKLYRQKGTGHARAGDIKSPLRRGGGTIFGPRPRKYGIKVNRKTQALARRSVLSHKAKGDAIRVIEDFSFESPDTREIRDMINALEVGNASVLLLTAAHDPNVCTDRVAIFPSFRYLRQHRLLRLI